MRTFEHCSYGLVAASVCLGCILAAPARAGEDAPGLTAKLAEIEDVRRTTFVKDDEMGYNSFNAPGLRMKFHLEAPGKMVIVDIQQPESIVATDASGQDLSKVEPDVFGEVEYFELKHQFEASDPVELELVLLPPKRTAETISLDATLGVTMFESLEERTLELGNQAEAVTIDGVPVEGLKAHISDMDGSAVVVFRPVGAKEYIDNVELLDGSTVHETDGTMWNEQEVGYPFSATVTPNLKVRLRIRKGLATVPCQIKLDKHPLP